MVFGISTLFVAVLLTGCSEEDIEWIEIPLAENVYYDSAPEYRSDAVEIPLSAGADLEYMLDMQKGQAVSYSWEANDISSAESLLIEFHGHTVRETEAPGDLMFYKQFREESSSGYLVAPFDGIHGWYFSNESNADINIVLTLSGFYTIP